MPRSTVTAFLLLGLPTALFAGGIRITEDRATSSRRPFSTSLNGSPRLNPERIEPDLSLMPASIPETLSAIGPAIDTSLEFPQREVEQGMPLPTPQGFLRALDVIIRSARKPPSSHLAFRDGVQKAEALFGGTLEYLVAEPDDTYIPEHEITEAHHLINLLPAAAERLEKEHTSFPRQRQLYQDALIGLVDQAGLNPDYPGLNPLFTTFQSMFTPHGTAEDPAAVTGFLIITAWRLGGDRIHDLAWGALEGMTQSLDHYTSIHAAEGNSVHAKSLSQLLPDRKTGYVYFRDFHSGAALELKKAIESLAALRLILDLRGNLGGYISEFQKAASLFLPPNNLILSRIFPYSPTEHAEHMYTLDSAGRFADLPLAVLVNANTASASERLAEAFQYYRRAPILGADTFGKRSVQTTVNLSPDVAITTSDSYTKKLNSSRSTGEHIQPDIPIEISAAEDAPDASADPAVLRALQVFE